MPIDFIHFELPLNSFEEYKKQVPILNWRTNVDLETGQILQSRIDRKGRYTFTTIKHYSKCGNLHFMVAEITKTSLANDKRVNVETKLFIKGSLHTNCKGNNYSDFTFSDLGEHLLYLQRIYKIPLDKAKILSFEYGLNIALPFKIDHLIDNILSYKGKYFYRYTPKEVGGFFDLSQFAIKVYNKGVQSQLKYENLLRFEIHLNRMQPVKKIGIATLKDLLIKNVVYSLVVELINKWEEILVFDILCFENLNDNQIKFLNEIRMPGYWESLYKSGSRQNRLEKKNRLRKLSKESGLNLHENIKNYIATNWDKLFN